MWLICKDTQHYELFAKFSLDNLHAEFNCGETLTNTSGYIYSPGYPEEYENNLDCLWQISALAEEVRFD